MGRADLEHPVDTLPYSWYVDPAVAAAEQEHIFRRSWQTSGMPVTSTGRAASFPHTRAGSP